MRWAAALTGHSQYPDAKQLGYQLTSHDWQEFLEAYNLTASMS